MTAAVVADVNLILNIVQGVGLLAVLLFAGSKIGTAAPQETTLKHDRIGGAKRAYVRGDIDVDEFERRVETFLRGERGLSLGE